MKKTVGGLVLPALSGGMAALAVLGVVEVTRSPEPLPSTRHDDVRVVQVVSPAAGSTTSTAGSTTSTAGSTGSTAGSTVSQAPADAAAPSDDPGWPVTPGSGGEFVSLTSHARQNIRPDRYTQLRFEGEQTDKPGWHAPGSALIVPTRTAVAHVCYKVTWSDDARPSQYYAQIARDPNGDIDVTGAEDGTNTLGRDYRALCWAMKVREGQPLAIRVKHDGSRRTAVEFAEFKVWMP